MVPPINMHQVEINNQLRAPSPMHSNYINSIDERKAMKIQKAKLTQFEPIDRRDLVMNRHDPESDLELDVAENMFDNAIN
jgi:hypothetical protein